MNYTSKNTLYYIEDEVLTVAFADSELADPDKYLILQREVDCDSDYYYEVNGQGFSNEGGIQKAEISDSTLLLTFNDKQRIHQEDVVNLLIGFKKDCELKKRLIDIFKNTDTKLVIN